MRCFNVLYLYFLFQLYLKKVVVSREILYKQSTEKRTLEKQLKQL